jgi:hypothetical protein
MEWGSHSLILAPCFGAKVDAGGTRYVEVR